MSVTLKDFIYNMNSLGINQVQERDADMGSRNLY